MPSFSVQYERRNGEIRTDERDERARGTSERLTRGLGLDPHEPSARSHRLEKRGPHRYESAPAGDCAGNVLHYFLFIFSHVGLLSLPGVADFVVSPPED